jgi:hypothetical protein
MNHPLQINQSAICLKTQFPDKKLTLSQVRRKEKLKNEEMKKNSNISIVFI